MISARTSWVPSVVGQGDDGLGLGLAVEPDGRLARLETPGVLDGDPVGRRAEAVGDLVAGPVGRGCRGRSSGGRRGGASRGSTRGSCGRARRPSRCTRSSRRGRRAAAGCRRRRPRRRARPCSCSTACGSSAWRIGLRIVEQLGGAAGRVRSAANAWTTQVGRVGVLAAVLADARQVALDVAGVHRLGVERRREQEDQPSLAVDQPGVRRTPSPGGRDRGRPRRRARPTTAASESIWQAALLGRAQRGAVVEVGAAIPVAVPGVGLAGGGQLARPAGAGRRPAPSRRAPRPARRTGGRSAIANQASQTLSPLPPAPTRFMPSFQSPWPISGRPWAPRWSTRSRPRRQCS